MPMLITVKIQETQYEQEISDDFSLLYVLGNGIEISVPRTLAWCGACAKAVYAEQLPDPKQIKDRIDQVRSGKLDDLLRIASSEEREEQAKYHETVLQWRKDRKDARKCLACGSGKVDDLNEPEGWSQPGVTTIVTEQGAFRVMAFLSGHKSKGGFLEKRYDPEGNKV
jgi:hypothetical protein